MGRPFRFNKMFSLPARFRDFDLKSLTRNLFFAATTLAALIPADVAAVGLLPSPPGGGLGLENGALAAPATPLSLKTDLGASAMFGAVSAPTGHAAAQAAKQLTDLVLKGVISLGTRDALIEDIQARKKYVVREGDAVRHFTVRAVEEDSVVLTDGRSEYRLKIEEPIR